jgi:hypothetical protein
MPGRRLPHGTQTALDQQIRLATALAHTVPGVLVELTCSNGERLTVGYGVLGTQATPCQVRTALLVDAGPGAPRLVEAVTGVEIVKGLDHLGGGLYQRGGTGPHPGERWFATTLAHDHVERLLAAAPVDLPHDTCSVGLSPDPELGITTVRVAARAHDATTTTAQLDEVAFWVLSACLVTELDVERTAWDPR